MENLGNIGLALLLVVVANTAAWTAGRLLRDRWSAPLDFGLVLKDGQRLFGSHKTWRGVLTGAAACGLTAEFAGWDFLAGAGFGAASLVGDALSSSVKRRLGLRPGAEVPGLDQIPEALLPLAVFGPALDLGVGAMAAVALVFTVLDIAATGIRHRA